MAIASSFKLEFILKNATESVIELISGQRAIDRLQQKDDYINNLSKFDLESRVCRSPASLQDYFDLLARHVLNWDKVCSESIRSAVEYMNTQCVDQLKFLKLPPRVFVVLTDGKGENNAAYCRNGDVIVIPDVRAQSESIRTVFIHELFHIWSKWNENLEIRDALYATIGYHRMPVENLPEFPADLRDIKMTNPDAPIAMEYYINLKKKGDTSNKTYKCTPILRALQPFDVNFSRNFFRYIIPTTLILDDNTYEALQPLEYLPYQQSSDFLDQIGNNTAYIIHPEEILAENFVFWMADMENVDKLQSPDIVKRMNNIISSASYSS